jgi:hypothetical protein
MSVTVWGAAGGPDELSEERDVLDRQVGAYSYRELSPELPSGGLEIDLDHDPDEQVGELVYAELGSDERLRCVAVVDDRLEPVLRERSVFFSPLLGMVGAGVRERSYIAREAELLGMSLTLETKRVGAAPVQWRAGDVRDPVARFRWPISWSQSRLLERSSQVGRRERAHRITDLRERDDDPPWRYREGEWIPLAERRHAGALRYRTGKILRVS